MQDRKHRAPEWAITSYGKGWGALPFQPLGSHTHVSLPLEHSTPETCFHASRSMVPVLAEDCLCVGALAVSSEGCSNALEGTVIRSSHWIPGMSPQHCSPRRNFRAKPPRLLTTFQYCPQDSNSSSGEGTMVLRRLVLIHVTVSSV